MIFSVQNSNLKYSVEFSPDLVQIQVRETVSGVFLARMDIPIQVWHMVEVMRKDFNGHHMMQVPITENQLGTIQGSFWSCGNELPRDSWLKFCSSTSRRLPPSVGGSRIRRKPYHNIWRWGLLRNNDASKHSSTTTTSNENSSSSAFYREPPELFCCSRSLWLNVFGNNCCLVLTSFSVINYFLQFHFN